MSWAGRWWRVTGILLLVATWFIASGRELLVMAGWGSLGLIIFVVTWFIAAWFDLNEKCCSPTQPHTRADYGEGQHWVTEEVR